MLFERLLAGEPVPPGWGTPTDRTFLLELPPDRTTPGLARHAVADACLEWGISHLTDTAQLAVSELVTNVVVHASTPLMLVVELDGGHLTIAVFDGDTSLPLVVDWDEYADHGRGVEIIDRLGEYAGAQRTVLGKLVWVAIGVDGEPRTPSDRPQAPRRDR